MVRSVNEPRSHPRQAPRRTAELPRHLLRKFREVSKARGGPTGSALAYAWLLDAVQKARTGHPLPAASTAPAGVESDLQWTQGQDEFREWKHALEAAGSSVRAVLADRIQRYIATGGDAVGAAQGDPERALVGSATG